MGRKGSYKGRWEGRWIGRAEVKGLSVFQHVPDLEVNVLVGGCTGGIASPAACPKLGWVLVRVGGVGGRALGGRFMVVGGVWLPRALKEVEWRGTPLLRVMGRARTVGTCVFGAGAWGIVSDMS